MALTSPFNILPGFPGWTTSFELRYRQEQSIQASGRVLVKDMGMPLWTLSAASKQMKPNLLDTWRAKLNQLENGLTQFWGYSMSRCYPILYPNGTWPTGAAFNGTTAVLATINANRKAVAVSSLPAGFVLSVGDYISIAGDLHQVLEPATASAGGVTPQFEIRPHLWTGVTTGRAVSVKQPACLMAVVPGSVGSSASLGGMGSISFQGIEARL